MRGTVVRTAAVRPLFGWKVILRQVLPPAFAISPILIFWQRFHELDLAQVSHTFALISPMEWAVAGAFTLTSFCAVGHYDRFWHGYFSTGLGRGHAWRTGMASVAVAQTTGFGLLVGAMMRWRLQPGIGPVRATQITLVVALSFLLGLGLLSVLVVSVFPLPGFEWARPLAFAAICIVAGLIGLAVVAPASAVSGWIARVLPLRALGFLFLLASVDSLAAAGALIVLIPGDAMVPLTVLLPAILIALAVGYLSGMPCGLGATDATLLMLLPVDPMSPIVAALVAFRLIYFGITAVIGGLWAVIGTATADAAETGRSTAHARVPGAAFLGHPLEGWLTAAPRAEAGLLRQGHLSLIMSPDRQAALIGTELAQCTITLGDPIGARGRAGDLIDALTRRACARARQPVLYKCGAGVARAARRQGLRTWPLAREAWIDPQTFTTDGSAKAGLRRQLRRAARAGIRVSSAGNALPMGDMARVSAGWAAHKDGERGFSTGRFHPDYVARQQVWLAWRGTDLVAWISFHENRSELTLDLMRRTSEAPDGTMHMLVHAAIDMARAQGRRRLSLASLPEPGGWLRQHLNRLSATEGLSRFKNAFDPNFETLYIAAPGWITLVLATLDIRRAIQPQVPFHMKLSNFHDHYDEHEFVS